MLIFLILHLKEFELSIFSIFRYAKHIQSKKIVKQLGSENEHLHNLQVFVVPEIDRFHKEAERNYPKTEI